MPSILTLSMAFLVSFVVTLMVIRYSSPHAHIAADWDLDGVQKFHVRPVPRVGGLGVVLALAVAVVVAWIRDSKPVGYPFLLLVPYVMPTPATGFIEDMTKRVSPRERLFATIAVALTAIYFLNVRIVWIDIHLIGIALALPVISIVIAAIAVAGLASSIDIIDGLNRLASTATMTIFISLTYVALHVGDTLILTITLAMIGTILGFFIRNFPAGYISLGDEGVCMIGLVLAECSILLVLYNVGVSTWYPVLMVVYPIFETLFSIYRRRAFKGVPAGYPDGVHPHTLIYRRVMRWAVDSKNERYQLRRDSLTSPYLWPLSLLAVLPATPFWNNELALLGFVVIFIFSYAWSYWRIARFQSPRWFIVKRHHRIKKHHEH